MAVIKKPKDTKKLIIDTKDTVKRITAAFQGGKNEKRG